jgi:uncharacterized membrane protein (UPF0127 family)
MKVQIRYKEKVLADEILWATGFYSRLIGLMFRESPPNHSQGLLLEPCNSIHTCFMRYPLDVVFLSRDNMVVKVIYGMRPWRLSWIYFKANKTLEMPAGRLVPEIKEGDYLEVHHV